LKLRLGEIGLELFEAVQAEDEGIEQGLEHGGGRDVGILAGIVKGGQGLAKMEDLVDVGVERRQRVTGPS
jgi:hypothetical protein